MFDDNQPTIPSLTGLHPESLRFLASAVFHRIDMVTKIPQLAEWANAIVIACDHQLNYENDDYGDGRHVPPLSSLSLPILHSLPSTIEAAAALADGFNIGLDADAYGWLAQLLAHVDIEIERRTPDDPPPLPEPSTPAEAAETMLADARAAAAAADLEAQMRADRPAHDLTGLPEPPVAAVIVPPADDTAPR